jgi:carbonic anhydrase
LFILRNAGNVVPPYGAASGGEAATVEYAVAALKVKDIIICGHSLCGAMDGLLHPDKLDGLTAVDSWLTYAQTTARIVEENYGHITEKAARLTATVEENVLVQIENLRTHPSVAAAVSCGVLKLHGWTYELETGQVFSYDPKEGQFLPIKQATGIPKPAWLRGPSI